MPATAPQLPSPADAYNIVSDKVFNTVFFNKLASYGYAPRTPQEAASLLELHQKLETVNNDPAVKAAEAAGNPYAVASKGLDSYLASKGLDGGIKQASVAQRDQELLQFTDQLMNDPDVYGAALTLKAAQAAELIEAARGN